VESELGDFCSALGPEDSPEKCWQAYSFLERRREAAAASCDWDRPESCSELDKLNTMAHELLATGSMDDVVATFSTLARVEEMRAARDARKAQQRMQLDEEGDVMERAFNTEEEEYLHSLFCEIDTNGDGMLSMTEFRQGMAMLGDELDENTVALIGDAMDIHGFINEQQFRDIVEAEQINSHSEVANLWRHHKVFGKRYR
jgi:Ca2+-binding EF-hand superfamily protein